ncbi:hypothetical protein TYRP_003735 [Tyrophagus putrescentiae]|nr:hypothetical protein TYRP_003735 [Tyrophagus putrescentiae]
MSMHSCVCGVGVPQFEYCPAPPPPPPEAQPTITFSRDLNLLKFPRRERVPIRCSNGSGGQQKVSALPPSSSSSSSSTSTSTSSTPSSSSTDVKTTNGKTNGSSPTPPPPPGATTQQQQLLPLNSSPVPAQFRKRSSTTVPPMVHRSTGGASIINNPNEHIVYRLVLTGGPCSGKTTGQARLSTFFENLGWKYSSPTVGGIRFPDMTQEEGEKFQENLIKVMIAMERTFFTLASTCKQNCIVICDRGIMDATAYMSKESWEKVLKGNGWNAVELRDNRYNQVVHLVTSASGAEAYYNCEDNPCRTEGLEQARELDRRTAEAWVGHPYIDVMDNSTDFDTKMRRMISAVCRRIGLQAGDRLKSASRKIKFLVRTPLPPESAFPSYQDFDVVHDYLITANPKIQSRLRKRGQSGNWSYQHTVRRSAGSGGDRDGSSQLVELRRQISHRDYVTMLAQRSNNHHTVYKVRRCFLWQQTYFQLDIYRQPCNSRCVGLVILETYTTLSAEELSLPPFLGIVREVTHDTEFSMYNLSSMSRCPSGGDSGKSNGNGHHHHHHHHHHNLKFENGSGNGCAAANGGGGAAAAVVNGKTSRKNSAPEAMVLNGNVGGGGGNSIINGGVAPKANASPSFVEELVDEK